MLTSKQRVLEQTIKKAIKGHPRLFDDRLTKGFYQLIANKDTDFFDSRTSTHLRKLLFAQFFLQKHMESVIANKEQIGKEVFVRIFSASSHICVAVLLSHQRHSEIFNEQNIVKAVQTYVSGVKDISHSFFSWQSIEQSTLFCYLELKKLRGKDLSPRELKQLQIDIQKHFLHEVISFCPSVFWPYNHEESYRQLILLQKEIKDTTYPPQISIHFKEQALSDLEFLIYMVRPQSKIPLEANIGRLPPSVRFFSHISSSFKIGVPVELAAFSLCIPTRNLDTHKGVNLLQARKSIAALLEEIVGPFRDFNGGLFTVQEDLFIKFKTELSEKIPDFPLFAEALFYSLKPIKRQTTLNMEQVDSLFRAFSSVMREKKNFFFEYRPTGVLVIKTKDMFFLGAILQKIQEIEGVSYGYLQLSGMHYLAFLDPSTVHASELEKQLSLPPQEATHRRVLRLAFQIGLLPSLNPYFLTSGFRSHTIYKALFEGLTRLDAQGNPLLTGAQTMTRAEDGLTITFELRQNHWSNGEKVTAYHYAEGWKQVLSLADSIDIMPLLVIKNSEKIIQGTCSLQDWGVYVRNPKTLEVHLEYPDPFFLHKLSQPLFFPIYDERKEPQFFNGPYCLYSQQEKSLILERNPHFWDRKNIHFDALEVSFVADSVEALDLYEKKFIDWFGSPFNALPMDTFAQLERKHSFHKQTFSRVLWLHVNTTHPALKSVSIRRALSLALNRDEIHRQVLLGVPLSTVLPPSLSLISSAAVEDFHQQANEQLILGLKECSLTRETFPTLQLLYIDNPRFRSLSEYLQKTWKEVLGIDTQLQYTEWNRFLNALERGDFHIAGCYEGPTHCDPLNVLEKFELLNASNFSRWTDPHFQKSVAQARIATSQSERDQWIEKAEQILIREVPVIPISNETQVYMHRIALEGYIFDFSGCVDFSYAKE